MKVKLDVVSTVHSFQVAALQILQTYVSRVHAHINWYVYLDKSDKYVGMGKCTCMYTYFHYFFTHRWDRWDKWSILEIGLGSGMVWEIA